MVIIKSRIRELKWHQFAELLSGPLEVYGGRLELDIADILLTTINLPNDSNEQLNLLPGQHSGCLVCIHKVKGGG